MFVSTDAEEVSGEELRKRIERFYAGDAEAMPSIFAAILTRKLAGKHDEADKKLMEEICGKREEPLDGMDDDESDSDEDFDSKDESGSDFDEDEYQCESDEDFSAKKTGMKRRALDE